MLVEQTLVFEAEALNQPTTLSLRLALSFNVIRTLRQGMGCFWIYRFWVVGWSAWTGNLRVAAYCAIALGFTAMFSPLWTFGIRNRKVALVVLLVGGIAFLFLNNL